MKLRLLSIVLALSLCLSACGGSNSADNSAADNSADAMISDDSSIAYDNAANYGMEVEMNTEEYSDFPENRFLSVSASPLSTFAADVDTASYTNLRRLIQNHQPIPEGAVRIEEMINYFSYSYPQPAEGEPFGTSLEIVPCPWNTDTLLLRIGMQTASVEWDELPPSNLVFLIDVSGSMDSPDKLPLVKQAFHLLTENLRPEDRISIVTYASQDKVVLDGATGNESSQVLSAIEDLSAGGSTAGAQGILTAYELASKHFIPGGNNRIILATDGDLNVGISSESELAELVREKKESGIFLSVLGFGTGNLKDNKLEALADNGNGNYAYIDSLLEARRVLVEEMGGTLITAAKDVKLQVEFNPTYLKGYRLIGYENRLLNAEDFSDDSKDGGEIGAGHRLTVLYELVPVDSPMEIEDVDLQYQENIPTGASSDWLTLSVRYKEPDGEESKLLTYSADENSQRQSPSEDTAFAAAVAAFGMLLRNSDYAGTSSFDTVLEQLREIPSVSTDAKRAEFVKLVELAAQYY